MSAFEYFEHLLAENPWCDFNEMERLSVPELRLALRFAESYGTHRELLGFKAAKGEK